MTHARGVEILSDVIGVEADHVTRALDVAGRFHAEIRTGFLGRLSADQFRRLIDNDRYTVAVVGNLALRFAGRPEDARLFMDVYKASVGATAHQPVIREGVGTLPQFHRHDRTQQVIRILQAAKLPPLHTDGVREIKPGFQVDPGCDDLPGWTFIQPDPDAEHRVGFTGGRLGYLAVMRWAGWGVLSAPLPSGLLAVCHPDYRDNPFPS